MHNTSSVDNRKFRKSLKILLLVLLVGPLFILNSGFARPIGNAFMLVVDHPALLLLILPAMAIGLTAGFNLPVRYGGGWVRLLRAAGIAVAILLIVGGIGLGVLLSLSHLSPDGSWGMVGFVLTLMIYGGGALTAFIMAGLLLFFSLKSPKR